MIKPEGRNQEKVRQSCVLNAVGNDWNGKEIPLLRISIHFYTEMGLT